MDYVSVRQNNPSGTSDGPQNSKENKTSVSANGSGNGFHADNFIAQIMLRAEHPEVDNAAEYMADIAPMVDPDTGVILDFDDEIKELLVSSPNVVREYNLLIDNLKDNLRQITELEQNLIRRHITSGKYMCALQAWFELNFKSHYRWGNFVGYVLNKVGIRNYTIRTAQRDIMLYKNLGAYEELLVNAGNTGLAISTIYLLANPAEVSDFALDWSLGLIQDQVNASKKSNTQSLPISQPRQESFQASQFSPGGFQSSILPPDAIRFTDPSYAINSRADTVKQQLTLKHVKKIAETAAVIENEVPDVKRPLIKEIALKHQVVSPELVRELSNQSDEVLAEIKNTGHIEYPVEVDGVVTQRNVPVSEASTTDLMMMRGEIDDERHKRHLQHRIDNAKEKELITKGIISEKVNTVDMKNIADDQHARIAEFIRNNPDLEDALLPLMNTIRSAQGSAGVRVVVCRLDYANPPSSLKNEYAN